MTKEEFEERKKEILKKANKERNDLIKQYCDANNPYKVGDIFTDHIGSIKIEKIKYSEGGFGVMPQCFYFGTELKKDGTPKKSGDKRQAWQSNDIKKAIQ
jgi:hypothetical protein